MSPFAAVALEFVDWSLYERVPLPPIPGNRHWLITPTSLPWNSMTVRSIRISLLQNGRILPLSHRLWWNSILEFVINQKIYLTTPLHCLADPAYILADDNIPPDLKFELIERHRFKLEIPLSIQRGELYNVRMYLDCDERNDIETLTILEGTLLRGVC